MGIQNKRRGRCVLNCKSLDKSHGNLWTYNMPRQARLDVPGALHHIMVRGINKLAIFHDKQDRARFLERLGQKVTEARASVYAWALR